MNNLTISFRLSAAEIGLLRDGLYRMSQLGRGLQVDGTSASFDPFLFPRNMNKGAFDAECAFRVLRLWERVHDIAGRGGRMRLDALELAAMMLALRVNRRELQHGHMGTSQNCWEVQGDRLKRKLERLRKRAKRLLIQSSGQAVYDERSNRWRAFVRWLRVNRLQCELRPKPVCPGLRQLRLAFLNDCVRSVEAELGARGLKLPSPRLLRRYVRVAKREVHRGRAGPLHNDLLNSEGRLYLANYVLRRMGRDGFEAPRIVPEAWAKLASASGEPTEAAQQVEHLKSDWWALERVARAEKVAAVQTSTGLSPSELARELEVSAGTIQRDQRVAALSDADKQRIRSGESIARVLETEGLDLPQWRQQVSQMTPAERVTFERSWRVASDAHDGRFSDALADCVISWAREQPLGFEDARSMFAEARERIYRAHRAHRLPAGLPSKLLPDKVIARCRPPDDPGVLYFETLIQWVLRFACQIAPEYDILDRAIHRVEQRLPDVFPVPYA